MKYASVDLGTNTIRLLIARKNANCSFDFIYQKSKIARIGEGFGKTKTIKDSALKRTLSVLEEYKKTIEKYGVKEVFAAATSAVREAENREWFVENIKQAGFHIDIITPEDEARLTHTGIVYALKDILNDKHWLAFDLGGGSTEFMFSHGNRLLNSFSIPFGGVKLFEMFIKKDPPARKELELISKYFKEQLKKNIKELPYLDFIVGNAGTVTSLAAIDMNMETYSFKKTENYKLTKSKIEHILEDLAAIKAQERLEKYKILEKGREDVIVVGAVVVKTILNFFDKSYIITTNGSLREGLIIERVCK